MGGTLFTIGYEAATLPEMIGRLEAPERASGTGCARVRRGSSY